MRLFRAVWTLHRWIGLAVGLVLLASAGTGLLLLRKKEHAWLQPPAMRGADGPPEALRPLAEVYAAAFALGAPELRSEADIARVDFRPHERVHKVVSKRGDVEVQVCAITLRTERSSSAAAPNFASGRHVAVSAMSSPSECCARPDPSST